MTAIIPESRFTNDKVTPLRVNGGAAASTPASEIELTEYQPLGVGIPDVVAVVRRHLRLIATIVLGATLLAILACLFLTKIYTASSTLVLERRDIRPFETDLAQTLERDKSAAETEMDVLRSRQFAGRVVDELALASNPEFNPQANASQKQTGLSGLLSNILGMLGVKQAGEGQDNARTAEIQRDYAISKLLSHLNVSRSGESLAVRVQVSNSNPKLAARIANTVADAYVRSSLEFKQSARVADKARALSSGGAVAFLRERTAQPLLITLRGEEARLSKEREDLASRYGSNHPKMIGYDSQIASVRRMIDAEVERILQDLEIEALKPSARVVSKAAVPTTPSFPKPQIIVPGVFMGSALLAFLLALVLEITDNKIRSGSRVPQLLRIPNLGYVPRLASAGGSRMVGVENGEDLQQSVFDEAIRSIYLACRAPGSTRQLNFVLVSACLDDPASTATAWGLAAAGAAEGRKVIFANLDPSQREGVKAAAKDRVKRFLKNDISLAALIGEASKTVGNTNLVDATDELSELSHTLNSKNLRNVLISLRRIGHDLIVLHAPPVLVVSDAIWLSQLVDGVLLTIAWGRTTEKELVDAVTELRVNGAPIIGTLIDDVDPVVQFRDGYGGRLTYYRQTRSHLGSRA